MAKKSALNQIISRTCVGIVNSMVSWKQSSRTALADFLGTVTWYVLARRRHIALTNLRLCFPDWTEEKRTATAKQVFRNLVRAALDHSVLAKGSAEQVQAMVKFTGKEKFLELCDEGPLIVVAPHFVGLDAGGIAINTFRRGASLYQTQSNPIWDKWAYDARKRFSDPVLIPKSNSAMKQVIRVIREPLPFYYLPDMDHGERNSVFVPFFGVQAATLPMVSKLAKLTKAKVIWGIAETTDEGYIMHLSDPLENFPTDDPVADTERLNRELEQFILRHPDQYLWTHRRFKTRPQGEPPVY
ncbi:lysophospholipid acyltransferase family protein [Parasutterella muris]|uniref:Lipid A biosynthesis acyltransferase n=1 Tax=Parasutterella muris TaxID=2565572 RepID=A0A6L6YE52_9BURK|nr:lipid A biosynthesis acyltransferase [Parasutterella muris]MVX55757.1 lipid A biosynthesis acyltransferase [Parasutterella muris]